QSISYNNEKTVLAALIARPELVGQVDLELEGGSADEALVFLREVVEFLRATDEPPTSAFLIEHFSGGQHDVRLREITRKLAAEWSDNFDIEAEFRDALTQIHKKQRHEMIKPLIEPNPHKKWTTEEAAKYSSWQSQQDGPRAKAN